MNNTIMSVTRNHVLLVIALVALLAVLVPSTANAEQVACSVRGGGVPHLSQ